MNPDEHRDAAADIALLYAMAGKVIGKLGQLPAAQACEYITGVLADGHEPGAIGVA